MGLLSDWPSVKTAIQCQIYYKVSLDQVSSRIERSLPMIWLPKWLVTASGYSCPCCCCFFLFLFSCSCSGAAWLATIASGCPWLPAKNLSWKLQKLWQVWVDFPSATSIFHCLLSFFHFNLAWYGHPSFLRRDFRDPWEPKGYFRFLVSGFPLLEHTIRTCNSLPCLFLSGDLKQGSKPANWACVRK